MPTVVDPTSVEQADPSTEKVTPEIGPTPLTASGMLTPSSFASGIGTAGPAYAKSATGPGSPTGTGKVTVRGDSAPAKVTRTRSGIGVPTGQPAGTVIANAPVLVSPTAIRP